VFVNLVDFDMLYGHRRDAQGYRAALGGLRRRPAGLEKAVAPATTLVLLTADHGNDPTKHETTDHTREYIPIVPAARR
jgi:phosphopentomutase